MATGTGKTVVMAMLIAWQTINKVNAPRSRPFLRPESGKIAVKVINHYGDEVLKVYDV